MEATYLSPEEAPFLGQEMRLGKPGSPQGLHMAALKRKASVGTGGRTKWTREAATTWGREG